MAPLPKRRHSSYRQAKRNRAIKIPACDFIICKQCQKETLSHRVCKNCGFYDGKQVILKKEKKSKDIKK